MKYGFALLSRRDYSRFEIEQKLASKEFDQVIIDQTLERLVEFNYIDDAKFSQRFLEYQAEQGKGPMKIRWLLQQKKISNELIEFALSSQNWSQRCKDLGLQQSRAHALPIPKEHLQKLYRKLLSRGFYPEDVRDTIAFIQQLEIEKTE